MKTDWRRAWRGLTPRVVLGFAALTAALMVASGVYLLSGKRVISSRKASNDSRAPLGSRSVMSCWLMCPIKPMSSLKLISPRR